MEGIDCSRTNQEAWFPSCWKGPNDATHFTLWSVDTGNLQVLAESMKRGKEPAGDLVFATSVPTFPFKKVLHRPKTVGSHCVRVFY